MGYKLPRLGRAAPSPGARGLARNWAAVTEKTHNFPPSGRPGSSAWTQLAEGDVPFSAEQ